MEQYLGEIRLIGFSYAPPGWALCNGQMLSIAQNSALFAILGTAFGGDGISTFGLPDLRGRVPINAGGPQGQGPGLQSYTWGESGGNEQVTLLLNQMPLHNHTMMADASTGTTADPNGANVAEVENPTGTGAFNSFTNGAAANPVSVSQNTITMAGGNLPHTNLQPYLAVNFMIALVGIFPSRS